MFETEALQLGSWQELFLRLGLASLLGLLLGLDRELKGHEAGIRTHALVALSSAVITVSSLMLYSELRQTGGDIDPLRAVQGLSQAIGFIAAGMIFVQGNTVRNMTTAANIWVAAAVGIASGAGQYRLVIVASAMAVGLLTVLKVFERFLPAEQKKADD